MLCYIFLALLHHIHAEESVQESCASEEGGEFCTQNSKVRHEVRYRGISPSYCFLGNKDEFVPKKINVKKCGWPGMSESVCEKSGCCFKDDVCYRPIRPAEVMTYYRKKWMTLEVANETCARNFMSLYCVQHDEDIEFVSRATCGISWLAGHIAQFNSSDKITLPYKKPEQCSQGGPIKVKCERDVNANYGLSLSRLEEKFSITNVPMQDERNSPSKRNLFCSYQIWTPTFEKFPRHIKNGTFTKKGSPREFKCRASKITVDNRAIVESNLTWTVRDEGGEIIENRTLQNTEKIKAMEVGKYTCKVKLLLKPGLLPDSGLTNERVIESYAYHYVPVTYEIRITITSNTESKARVENELLTNCSTYLLLLSDKVELNISYQGYPYPGIKIFSSSHDPQYSQKEHFRLQTAGSWVMESFGEMDQDHVVWLYHADHVEEVLVKFISETPDELIPIQFFLKKVFIVSQIKSQERELDLTGNEPHQLQCYGYGSPPEAEPTWSIDGESLSERGVKYQVIDDLQGFIQIVPDSPLYSGRYLCELDNGAGSVNVSYDVRVKVAPFKPDIPKLQQGKEGGQVYRLPIAQDVTWGITGYHITVSSDSDESEVLKVTLNVVNETILIPEDLGNLNVKVKRNIEITHTAIGTDDSKYRMRYSVSNEYGMSALSLPTPWTVPQSEFNTNLIVFTKPAKFEVTNDTVILELRDRNTSVKYDVTYHPADEVISDITLTTITFDGNETLEISSLEKDTRYVLYVQAFLTKRNVTKRGPSTDPIILRTAKEMFDVEAHKPKKLNVQQIAFEDGKTEMFVVALVRWKFTGPLSLVRNFKLKVRKGSIVDMNKNDNEYEETWKVVVNRDDIARTATSKMLTIKKFQQNKVYNFFLWTISESTGEKSEPATFQMKFSEERCPVPPPNPVICGVLVRNDHQLVVLVNDETPNREYGMSCYTDNGTTYEGKVHRTIDGELCKNWNLAPEYTNLTRNLTKNYCRNPGNPPNKQFHGPWCFTADNVSHTCNVAPCGQYLTNVSFPSGNTIVTGTEICIDKKTSDRTVNLTTWYDYGPGAPTCDGNQTQLVLKLGEGILVSNENEGQKNYDNFRKKIWYKYIWLVMGNFQIMVIINLIIYCKQRIVKNLERDRKQERNQENINKALSAKENKHY